uniref:Mid2 domain-containing protein n=1 Tax=Tolypocladium ophioglossoides (strain CBS 100239) TaxID=1163406 RepID=A0A0L0NNS3_TOLOC
MARKPVPLRLLLLTAVAASTVSATPASKFFVRADTCAANGLQACSKDLPDQFCCPQGSSCISLAGATTVLCCPNDRTCSKIQPITCNVREQDPAKNSKAPIQTTVFDVALQNCGDAFCCPFGYSCSDGGKECTMNQDQSKAPKDEQPSSSPTTTTAEPTVTSTRIESATSASSTTPSQESSGPSSRPERTSIIGGAVGGCLVLLLVITVVILCIRRRRRDATSEKSSFARSNTSGSGPYGNVISAPVLHPGSYRSDFLRGSPPARRSFDPDPRSPPPDPPPASRPPRISIPNPFDSPNPSGYSPPVERASITSHDERTARTGHVVGARLAPIRTMKASEVRQSRRPSTQHVQREPSSESINIFADPSTMHNNKDNRTTTLSDMMEQAGLGDVHRGRPYVPGTTPRI